MLTPRRTLMLLAGFLAFGTAYATYARFLGWLDGLPQLPANMQIASDGEFRPPENPQAPTQVRLADAFGPKAPETDYAYYPNQFSFLNGDSVVVLASGPVPANPDSHRVTLTPFSLAIFGKHKPAHLRQLGEVAEITTIHSDKGILEFDRKITTPNDMRTAKLVRLELISDIEQTFPDPRRGMVHITNNQRSPDRDRQLTIRTVGPVFYRDAKAGTTPSTQGPDLWTDAYVEIVDRQNLPRAVGSSAPTTVVGNSADVRSSVAVADILAGRRQSPPTVTAIGLRAYLEPSTPPGQPKPKKVGAGGMSGIRRIDLLEQVLVNLWVDNGQSGFGGPPAPGASNAADSPKSSSLSMTPPPAALAAVTGNMGTSAYTARLMNRALLQIETRGPFAYDADKSLARFDVVPHSDPNLPNDVQVTKVPATGGTSTLFSQVLELELNGGATTANRPANSPAIKRIHAWTYTAGRFLSVAAQQEATEAYGQDLTHDQSVGRTVLTGSPLYVVRERNVLSAGAPQRAAMLVSEPGPGPDRKSVTTVRGPGRIDLFDAATNATTFSATWQTSLVQTKDVVNAREQDLFTFTDDAKFDDVKADYWLKGKVLKLWLEPSNASNPAKPQTEPLAASPGQARPSRIQAIGQVTSHSTDFDIEEASLLNVFFAEGKAIPAKPQPSPLVASQPAPVPKAAAITPPAVPPIAKPQAVTAEKSKPPHKIRAKTIDTWLTRVPTSPKSPAKSGEPPADSMKYQLDRARCEDNVTVHQDPTHPTKARGTDIIGRLLLIAGSVDGSILTVYGWPNRPGEVHQEEMSLIGSEVILDQVHNAASVKGRGALTMPTNSDLSGGDLAKAEVMVIHWRESMVFNGAKKSAEFVGKVSARQGESWVLCHTMHVKFDRPIFFNQAQKSVVPKPANPKGPRTDDDKAKIDTVYCYPAAGDSVDDKKELFVTYNQVEFDKTGKMVKSQQLTAQELKMEAQARETPGGAPFQRVTADGPGLLRVWQPGDKDTGPAPKGNNAVPPKGPMPPAPQDTEQEMKLTVVTFRGHMVAIDKGKVFQKATFESNVEAVTIPADSPTVEVQRHRLPPRATLLKCDKELVIGTHKKPNEPSTQRLDAYGNAYLRTDDHDGWGETITHEGKVAILTGSEAIPARIMNRFNQGTDQSAKKIIYDRGTGSIKFIDSFGGTLGGSPGK